MSFLSKSVYRVAFGKRPLEARYVGIFESIS